MLLLKDMLIFLVFMGGTVLSLAFLYVMVKYIKFS